MANTTQDQENNATENEAANEVVKSEENEESSKKDCNYKNNDEIENNGLERDKVEEQCNNNDDEDEDEEEYSESLEEGDIGKEEHSLESKLEKLLDHDQDRRNPQYIPKGGAFYEHDNRTASEDVENKDPQELEKKKKVWKESKESERWLHDRYKESEQQPKSEAEIIEAYGYDIRIEEAPPRARRRRKYGRGPDKYDRNWEDEQAYMVKPNVPGRRGKKKSFGKEEFPPLPNNKNDSGVEKTPSKSQNSKKTEDDLVKKSPKVNNYEKPRGSSPVNRNDNSAHRNNVQGASSNKKNIGSNKRIIKNDIKPFKPNDKTKWKNNFRRGKPEEILKANKTKSLNQETSRTNKNTDSNKNYSGDSEVTHLTEGFSQMNFQNNHSSTRDNGQDSNEVSEQTLDSPANRLNPKRYSKTRKGFTGFFPPEEIVEIDPAEMKQLQQEQQQKSQHANLQQQPLNIQSVIRRFPGTYNGNPGYIAPRPVITGLPQQGMSPQGIQQALSPQCIPQQALSPQVPGLQIELQQGPIPPQPNFVPHQMYIDMDAHYGPSDMMGPYTGYAPYSANQPSEMYQPSGGITYYNTECQNSNQIRVPPSRKKRVIPIVPPPE